MKLIPNAEFFFAFRAQADTKWRCPASALRPAQSGVIGLSHSSDKREFPCRPQWLRGGAELILPGRPVGVGRRGCIDWLPAPLGVETRYDLLQRLVIVRNDLTTQPSTQVQHDRRAHIGRDPAAVTRDRGQHIKLSSRTHMQAGEFTARNLGAIVREKSSRTNDRQRSITARSALQPGDGLIFQIRQKRPVSQRFHADQAGGEQEQLVLLQSDRAKSLGINAHRSDSVAPCCGYAYTIVIGGATLEIDKISLEASEWLEPPPRQCEIESDS